jgi:alanine racemase
MRRAARPLPSAGVTVRLSVDEARWRVHVDDVVHRVDGLVPVVKGNGYGFGRRLLADLAATFADVVAVGSVHELAGLPSGVDAAVLTPTLDVPPAATGAILTIGADAHVHAIARTGARVLVKLRSSMQRYGRDATLVATARAAGLDVVGVSIHPPLAGDDDDHTADVTRWLPDIDPALEVWVSHLSPSAYEALPATHRYRLRLGTALWHGDRSMLHLDADVIDAHAVHAGATAGYRLGRVPDDGTVVMIGAGSAHGVQPLPDGRSPFHFRRCRLALLEPPHMHTSMAFVPAGDPCPAAGDRVDVQRPLTTTIVDEIVWR